MRLTPPGTASTVAAQRALVLAPHYDDEVLGCGGLLGRLADAGTELHLLFLTNSDGAQGTAEQRAALSRLRRAEASRAAETLGVLHVAHADLPDGALELHLDELGQTIAAALDAVQPDLLLLPSPLEVSLDHRAVLPALHRLLAPLRGGEPLWRLVSALDVLLFEVNHPAYPDLLVDVSDQLERLSAAMGCYPSQQAEHDYLAAALGLRRYRAHSLPTDVRAAEGYRRLRLDDFTTRTLSALVERLGGTAKLITVEEGPLISVVVRTCDRPALLREALASLRASSYRRLEVILVNDGGAPPELDADAPPLLLRVDHGQRLGRSAAANAGLAAATGDYVAFLDDDDRVQPEHYQLLAGLIARSGARVAYSDAAVVVCEPSGDGWAEVERTIPYSRDFDPELLLLDNYIPFNTLVIERQLARDTGELADELPFFEDWDWLIRLAERAGFLHLRQVTCEYRHFRTAGHHALGEQPRQRADFLAMKRRVLERHAHRLSPELLAVAIDRLRLELVQTEGRARAAERGRRDLAGQLAEDRHLRLLADALRIASEHRLADQEAVYHRLNGERAAVAAENERLRLSTEVGSQEIARLQSAEHDLVERLRSEGQLAARLYEEIERLGRELGALRASRFYRWHQRWQRLKGRG